MIPFFLVLYYCIREKMVLIVHDVYVHLLLIVDWSLIMSSLVADNA